jgi:hypothetical protein
MITEDHDIPRILSMENRMYPEFGAGYYAHSDCTVAFYRAPRFLTVFAVTA